MNSIEFEPLTFNAPYSVKQYIRIYMYVPVHRSVSSRRIIRHVEKKNTTTNRRVFEKTQARRTYAFKKRENHEPARVK